MEHKNLKSLWIASLIAVCGLICGCVSVSPSEPVRKARIANFHETSQGFFRDRAVAFRSERRKGKIS